MTDEAAKEIPLLDLKLQYSGIRTEIDEAVHRVLESGQFILGEEVEKLEKEVAAYCGSAHGVGVASGTDALLLALEACGVGDGDEVITTPHTFIATAEAIARAGARIVFADIEPGTYTIDPARIEEKISRKTKAVIPVHIYGLPCDMDAICDIARRKGLMVIEDLAQAFGAEWKGKRVGSIGNVGATSFFPSKNLGAYGDGGMLITNDEAIASRVRMLRVHGARSKYEHAIRGYNSRLDALQAAILRVKLGHVDRWNELRRENAARYTRLLGNSPLVERLPGDRPGGKHVYHLYTVELTERDGVEQWLRSRGIACGVYYPVPLHCQEVYRSLGYRQGNFPVTEECSRRVLSLPMYPELKGDLIETVCSAITEYPGQKFLMREETHP